MPLITPNEAMSVMPNYPSILGNGMATGFQAAGQMNAANRMIDLAQQGAQTNQEAADLDLQNKYQDQGLNDLKRQLGMIQTQQDIGNADLKNQVTQSDYTTKLDANQASMEQNESKRREERANEAFGLSQSIQGQDSIASLKDPDQEARIRKEWNSTLGRQFGELPDNPIAAAQMINGYGSRAKAYLDLQKAKLASMTKTDVAGINAGARVGAANTAAQSRIEVARIYAQAKAQAAAAAQKDPKTFEQLAVRISMKSMTLPPGEELDPKEQAILDVWQDMKKIGSTETTQEQLESVMHPEKPSPKAQAKQELSTHLDVLKGGNTPAQASPPAAKPKTPPPMTDPGVQAKIKLLKQKNPNISDQDLYQGLVSTGRI